MTREIKKKYRESGRMTRRSEFCYAKALGNLQAILEDDSLMAKERVARALAFLEGFGDAI